MTSSEKQPEEIIPDINCADTEIIYDQPATWEDWSRNRLADLGGIFAVGATGYAVYYTAAKTYEAVKNIIDSLQ